MSKDRLAAAERLLGLKVLECDALRAALEEITKREGPYKMDRLKHAEATIEAMAEIARQALVGQPEEGK